MKRLLLGALVLLVLFLAVLLFVAKSSEKEIEPLAENHVTYRVESDGVDYLVTDEGIAYRVNPRTGGWIFVEQLFDPQTIADAYVVENEIIYRIADDRSKRYPVLKNWHQDFDSVPEGVAGTRVLVGPEYCWTELTLQTPQTPNVSDYVKLRGKILKGESDFLDAQVVPSKLRSKSGDQSLLFVSPAKPSDMICCKSSLSTGLVYAVQGDDFWYQAYYYIDGATRPFTLADLECDFIYQSPGIRLMLFPDGDLGAELKSLDKPKYRQKEEDRINFPVDQWVQVTWHVHLDMEQAGHIEIWQDGKKIVDERGTTLPLPTAIYNSLEVGISAHSFGDQPVRLFVDDVTVADHPLQ